MNAMINMRGVFELYQWLTSCLWTEGKTNILFGFRRLPSNVKENPVLWKDVIDVNLKYIHFFLDQYLAYFELKEMKKCFLKGFKIFSEWMLLKQINLMLKLRDIMGSEFWYHTLWYSKQQIHVTVPMRFY